MKIWMMVCALWVQRKLFISFCLEFGLFLAVMGLCWSVKHSFFKITGRLRRASLELWTLMRKQERKGLIRKKPSIWPKFTCVGELHKPPQVLHPLGLPLYCSSSRPRDHRMRSSSVSFYLRFLQKPWVQSKAPAITLIDCLLIDICHEGYLIS